MRDILTLIRWKNLLLIILVQTLIKYALFEPFGIATALSASEFLILVLASVFIAAAGNIINDIYDVDIDNINKPNTVIVGKKISEANAYNLYIALNIIGVALGFYLATAIGQSKFFIIFVIISALLYVYSTSLKQIPLAGNIIISILVGLTVLIVGVFDLIPAVTQANKTTQLTFLKIIFDYSLFAFLINLIREIIKDIEDIDGDHKAGIKTLPIVLGRERAKKIVFALSFLPLAAVIHYIITYLFQQQIAVIYFLVAIAAPLIFVTIKIFLAKTKKDYHFISSLLKIVMLLGMLSLPLFKYILLP
ncbi:geranylgeranylglycerol-phosphate geranylgeranyltransferase [Lacinutrix undariae]